MKETLVLGIESSCDETSVAVVKNGREVLSNVIDTQIKIHEQFGGVVPEIASRNHIEAISRVTKLALEQANVKLEDIDVIVPTYGPGLVGALLVGVSYGRGLAYALNKPLVGVNHLEGHISANYITHPDLEPPFLCMLTSGGNTQIVYVKDYCDMEVLGRTRDDAIGEAFDKVARVIGLTYPGGPKIDKLAEQITQVFKIQQFIDFKSGCADIVSYIANIEYIDLGATFKTEFDAAKAEFRSIRDSIMDGISGETAAQKVDAILSKVKAKYIDIYFENHKKKRLDITDAQRRGKIQEGRALASLRKLRSIEILSAAKLTDIETEMSSLKVCYELTHEELKSTHICPHCRYHLDDKVKNVYGVLDNLENRIDDLLADWSKTLLDTISDPIVASQKKFLSTEQQKVIDEFIASATLPKRVDDFFVKAINALLKGFEPVVIDTDDLMAKLEQLPPMDEASFKARVNEMISAYTKGKDADKLRIVVKRKESEV